MWDAATGQPLGEPLKGHTGRVLSVSLLPDGTRIASGSDDHTVRMWGVVKVQPSPESRELDSSASPLHQSTAPPNPPSQESQIPPHLCCVKAPHLPPKKAVSYQPVTIASFLSHPVWNTLCPTPLTCSNPPLIMILIQPLSCCKLMDG
ncbi:uncharacterized protein EDB93DRAFT_1213274 [Suillus bovinus]|uniref:uncharacterized protein n=1 Tax=Suillus bovinus TaxID=48563 RepID=UPI001B875CBF|nr:uncharacterized protein EDB93DRAFT_1213274 [Suillus bovinus]KAG2131615.1 hypothetical protein EDB93DRAFT_1213274 [Suillus bovinus]